MHVPVRRVVRLDALCLHLDHQAARPLESIVGLVFEIVAGHRFENVGREVGLDHLPVRRSRRRRRGRRGMLSATTGEDVDVFGKHGGGGGRQARATGETHPMRTSVVWPSTARHPLTRPRHGF